MRDIQIRDFDSIADTGFILDSWNRSFAEACHIPVSIPPTVLPRLLQRSSILIAAEREQPDIIIGYIVFETDMLHYLYVKKYFRGFGIASELIKEADLPRKTKFTHYTERGRDIFSRLGFAYHPYFEL